MMMGAGSGGGVGLAVGVGVPSPGGGVLSSATTSVPDMNEWIWQVIG
jgi:hypothetical protein